METIDKDIQVLKKQIRDIELVAAEEDRRFFEECTSGMNPEDGLQVNIQKWLDKNGIVSHVTEKHLLGSTYIKIEVPTKADCERAKTYMMILDNLGWYDWEKYSDINYKGHIPSVKAFQERFGEYLWVDYRVEPFVDFDGPKRPKEPIPIWSIL